jgi:hypothetical protein
MRMRIGDAIEAVAEVVGVTKLDVNAERKTEGRAARVGLWRPERRGAMLML